jgi:hypothetical protein
MRSKRRRAKQSWTRKASGSQPPHNRTSNPAARTSESADTGEGRLGPYESRYDIALGYGTDRLIITR